MFCIWDFFLFHQIEKEKNRRKDKKEERKRENKRKITGKETHKIKIYGKRQRQTVTKF